MHGSSVDGGCVAEKRGKGGRDSSRDGTSSHVSGGSGSRGDTARGEMPNMARNEMATADAFREMSTVDVLDLHEILKMDVYDVVLELLRNRLVYHMVLRACHIVWCFNSCATAFV